MKTKALLTAALLAALPTAALAGPDGYHDHDTPHWFGMEGPYVTALGGWNNTEDDGGFNPDDGWMAGFAMGGKTKWARAELEGMYRTNDLNGAGSDSIDSVSIMGNAYWDFETGTRFTPYIGGGLGAAYVNVDAPGGDNSWEFAYQGMAGVNFDVNPNWTVGAEYRYFATTEVNNTDYNNHGVLGTVRYTF